MKYFSKNLNDIWLSTSETDAKMIVSFLFKHCQESIQEGACLTAILINKSIQQTNNKTLRKCMFDLSEC